MTETNVCRQDTHKKTTPVSFLEDGNPRVLGHGLRREEGSVECTKRTYPQETDLLQHNYPR